MCGRYVFADPGVLPERFHAEAAVAVPDGAAGLEVRPRFDVAPGQRVPVVVQNSRAGSWR